MSIDDYSKEKLDAASQAAGEYLQELGKTDLVTLSREEWLELLHVIIYNADITAPF